jgi:F-type H+-transporting ATPase subunit c
MYKHKKTLVAAVLATVGLMAGAPVVALATGSVAQDAGTLVADAATTAPDAKAAEPQGSGDNEWSMKMFIALGAGLGLGIAAAGGALGQGRAAAAALDGIARNPGASGKIFTPMILALALIESLVIYSLVISILLFGKL